MEIVNEIAIIILMKNLHTTVTNSIVKFLLIVKILIIVFVNIKVIQINSTFSKNLKLIFYLLFDNNFNWNVI